MSEQVPGAVGGVIPKIPRGRTDESYRKGAQEALDRVGGTVLEYHREKVSEARVLGFAGGVVVGVAWMLLVLLLADRVL